MFVPHAMGLTEQPHIEDRYLALTLPLESIERLGSLMQTVVGAQAKMRWETFFAKGLKKINTVKKNYFFT